MLDPGLRRDRHIASPAKDIVRILFLPLVIRARDVCILDDDPPEMLNLSDGLAQIEFARPQVRRYPFSVAFAHGKSRYSSSIIPTPS